MGLELGVERSQFLMFSVGVAWWIYIQLAVMYGVGGIPIWE
jgi:hypothetical protein